MNHLKISEHLVNNYFFIYLLKYNKKMLKKINFYQQEYETILEEVVKLYKKENIISLKKNDNWYLLSSGYFFEVNLNNDFSIYRENTYSIFYQSSLKIFNNGRGEVSLMPEEDGEPFYLNLSKKENFNNIISIRSDIKEGLFIYKEIENFLLYLGKEYDTINKIAKEVFLEMKKIKNLEDVFNFYPFLLKYFPKNYFNKEIEWLKKNLSNFPLMTDLEKKIFEINFK